jgi:hypothetical protein
LTDELPARGKKRESQKPDATERESIIINTTGENKGFFKDCGEETGVFVLVDRFGISIKIIK